MSDFKKQSDLKKILIQSHMAQSDFLALISGLGMGFGVFLVPGLLVGVIVTRSTILIGLLAFFASVLVIGALLQWYFNASEKKYFLRKAAEQGISKQEAEKFLAQVDWDKMFPESD